MFSNKTYNIVKWVVLTVLPALSVLVGTLGKAYGWNDTDLATTTLSAIALFLGSIAGVSSLNYNKKKEDDEK